jgi:hypothetical protein
MIGVTKYLGEFAGDLIDVRRLTHVHFQKAEWILWNFERYVADLDIRLVFELNPSPSPNTEH